MNNIKNEKFDIIVIAGQSNADCNGISEDSVFETRNDIFEMIDANKYYLDFSNPDKPVLKITLPVQTKIQCLQERFGETQIVCDFSIPFVDEYVKSKYFDKSRKLLVIKSAVGGTGFCKKEWGKDCFLYKRLCDMVEKALSFNKENRLVAFLWHQGECDAFENPNVSPEVKEATYIEKFMEQINDFKSRFNYKLPIIMGEMVNEWANLDEFKKHTTAIESALRKCAETLGNSTVVSSEGLKSNNEAFGNGDNIHFCKKSLTELGKRYYKAYNDLMKDYI